MAKEGNLLAHLYPDAGPSLNVAQAHKIVTGKPGKLASTRLKSKSSRTPKRYDRRDLRRARIEPA